jgi:SAM-dependent methyltransferase
MHTEANYGTAGRDEENRRAAGRGAKAAFRDRRAGELSGHAASTGYADTFIKIMRPRRNWTILDMGCGTGTIAVPLAKRVRKVTACDLSMTMLDMLKKRCREKRILNIDAVRGGWEDDWPSLGIGTYDVAIASRSLIGDDVRGCIEKLSSAARKGVYISTMVGCGPFDRRLFEATGRQFGTGPDYIYYYNLLSEMGLRVNLVFIPENHRSDWATLDDAVDGQRWMFRECLTEDEEQRVRTYLEQHLIRLGGRWRLPYARQCAWAVLWWVNEGSSAAANPSVATAALAAGGADVQI